MDQRYQVHARQICECGMFEQNLKKGRMEKRKKRKKKKKRKEKIFVRTSLRTSTNGEKMK